jgi:hypothetical protein
MIFGISGAPIPATLPYASNVTAACIQGDMPPCFVYAIAWRESISGELEGLWPNASTVVSTDNGHGLMQLTSSWPDNWAIPTANAEYAIDEFILPAIRYWHGLQQFSGDDLVRLVAATYNAGLGNAIKGHEAGNVDLYTTNNYAAGILANLKALVAGLKP